MEGVCVFSSVASSLASLTTGALFEAMIAAATIARDHGFHHILFLTDSSVDTLFCNPHLTSHGG